MNTIFKGDIHHLVVHNVVVQWFLRYKPDGIIAGSINPFILEWVRKSGARVPEDVNVATLVLFDSAGGLSGVYQDFTGRAAAAVELLVMKVESRFFGLPAKPKTILIEGQWYDGGTTRLKTPVLSHSLGHFTNS